MHVERMFLLGWVLELAAWTVDLFGYNNAVHIKDFILLFTAFLAGCLFMSCVIAWKLVQVRIDKRVDEMYSLVHIHAGKKAQTKVHPRYFTGIGVSFPRMVRFLSALMFVTLTKRNPAVKERIDGEEPYNFTLLLTWVIVILILVLVVFGVILSTHVIPLEWYQDGPPKHQK